MPVEYKIALIVAAVIAGVLIERFTGPFAARDRFMREFRRRTR